MKTLPKWIATFFICLSSQVMAEGKDTREVIWLTEGERTALLTEMRHFLSASQQILAATLAEDTDAVEAAARPVGMKLMKNTPDALKQKLPQGFGQFGAKTHRGFEDIANEASGMGDSTVILKQLSQLQTNCIACHAQYQFKVAP